MNKIDSLIETLASEPGTTMPLKTQRPAMLFIGWAGVAIIYLGAVMAFYLPLRPDFMTKLANPLFAAEIILLGALAFSSLYSAAQLGFPTIRRKRLVYFLPPILFALFTMTMALAAFADNPPAPQPPHAMECLICITMLSVAPACMIFYKIRKLASTNPAYAGCYAAFAAFAMGALSLRLSEETDSISHLLTWHYVPMLGFAIIGIMLGKKLFKW